MIVLRTTRRIERKQIPFLDDLARSLEGRMRATFLEGIEEFRERVDLATLRRALQTGSPAIVEAALQVEKLPDTLTEFGDVILEAARSGGHAAAAHLPGNVGLGLRFDILDPRALAFVQAYAADLIREVTDSTRGGIRELISAGFTEGRAPLATARRIREQIGLTAYQERIAQNYEATLRAAIRGEATWEDVNRYRLNPIRGPGGLLESRVDAAVKRYRERLLAFRAETIARTETLKAAHAGQTALWEQLDSRGALPPGTKRKWITARDERVCPICGPLDKTTAPLAHQGGTYPGGYDGPPAHPRCRCTEALTGFDDLRAQVPKPQVAPEVPKPDVAPARPVVNVHPSLHTPEGRVFTERMERTIDSLPGVREKFAAAGYQFRLGETLLDQNPHLKGVHPRGWPRGTTWASAEGLHRASDRTVHVTRTLRPIGQKKFVPSNRPEGVLRHEVGHAVGRIQNYHANPELRAAYDRDKRAQTPEQRARLSYFRQRGEGGIDEALAEGYGTLRGGGSDDPATFAAGFPSFLTKYEEILVNDGL